MDSHHREGMWTSCVNYKKGIKGSNRRYGVPLFFLKVIILVLLFHSQQVIVVLSMAPSLL